GAAGPITIGAAGPRPPPPRAPPGGWAGCAAAGAAGWAVTERTTVPARARAHSARASARNEEKERTVFMGWGRESGFGTGGEGGSCGISSDRTKPILRARGNGRLTTDYTDESKFVAEALS